MDPHSHGTLQSFSLQAFNEAVARCDVKILDPLITKHPELRDIQDIVHGDTLLHLMAESSIASWVKWALDKGIDVNAVNKNAETALHVAANMDDGDMVDLLIERGANRDAMDHEGVTPLQVAGGLGCDMALERLIGAGADPFAQDKRGRSFVVDFLFCTAHREWNQTLATAQRIERMIEIEPEFGARAWEAMQENKEILAINQDRFPSLTSALEAAWLRVLQPQAIVQPSSRPRF